MKNFILVINKEKIYAYVLSVCTIVTLFFMSGFISNNFEDTESTSSNIVENTITNKTDTNNINEINNIT
ncbi:MAG: hypothetical protein HFJ17_00885 [Clostridia bacterium]|nr:hypothetical protein [Clostridia bacterium]